MEWVLQAQEKETKLMNHWSNILSNKDNLGKSRYKHIETMDVVNNFRDKGWIIRTVSGSTNFSTHMVRMVHPEITMGNDRVELVVSNSYNGRTTLKIKLGIFRLVCSNGLIVGDTFFQIEQKHIGGSVEQELENKYEKLVAEADKLKTHVEALKTIKIDNIDPAVMKRTLETITTNIVGEKEQAYATDLPRLIKPTREEDEETTLWNVLNIVQEKAINGGVPFKIIKDDKTVIKHTQKKTSPSAVLEINTMIFEEFSKLAA